MRASVLTLLSAAAAVKAAIEPATVVVEKSVGNGYQNTTVQVPIESDFTDPEVLAQVSTLYQIAPAQTYFCFAYKPDGTFYSDDYFGLNKPLRLSTNNVVVKAITCRIE